MTYYWQAQGIDGTFSDILINDGVTTHPATGTTFTPGDLQAGFALRVRAVYTDANGIVETVFSAPTAQVEAVNDPHTGSVTINDTTPTQDQALVAVATLVDPDQPTPPVVGGSPPTITFNYQWQRSLDLGLDVDRHRRCEHGAVRADGGGCLQRRQIRTQCCASG